MLQIYLTSYTHGVEDPSSASGRNHIHRKYEKNKKQSSPVIKSSFMINITVVNLS